MAHPPLKANEILVRRDKHFSVYMKRIHKLFSAKQKTPWTVEKEKDKPSMVCSFDEVFIQGMGACVQRASDLALETQETYPDIQISDVQIFTVPITDTVIQKEPNQ